MLSRRNLLRTASFGALLLATQKANAFFGMGKCGDSCIEGPPPEPPEGYTGKISAGVFNSDGLLIRTIYADEDVVDLPVSADVWDGYLDDGSTAAPAGNYTVKFLTHSVAYAWDGLVGNTSTNPGQTGRYHGYGRPWAICIPNDVTNYLYWAGGYSEAVLSVGKTAKDDLGVTTTLGNNGPVVNNSLATNAETRHIVSDGTRLYWSGMFSDYGGTPSGSFVYATLVSDDTKVTFANGEDFAPPDQFYFHYSAINKVAADGLGTNNAIITGLAVQKTANYLFVARSGKNTISVVHKTTGLLTQTFSITKPTAMAVTSDDKLWVIHGDTPVIDLYTCDGSGNLSIVGGTTISGLSNPLAMAVHPTVDRLLVVDGGTSQTVKAFVASTGAADTAFGSSGVFGTVGGYDGDPTVTNTKFMFTQGGDAPNLISPAEMSYIAFDPADNSWWLCDWANFRYLHFSSGNSPTYIEHIQWLGSFICSSVCMGDPTRVFFQWLEFTIDYSKSLSPTNGSWVLAKNWGYGMKSPSGYNNYSNVMGNVAKLANGRTYCSMKKTNNQVDILELTSSGLSLVVANIDPSSGGSLCYIFDKFRLSDDALIGRPTYGALGATTFYKNSVVYDGGGNPTWQTQSTDLVTSSQPDTGWPAADSGFGGVDVCAEMSTGGLRWVADVSKTVTFHLCAVDNATGAWKWAGWRNLNSKFYPQYAAGNYDPFGYAQVAAWPGHGYYINNLVKNGGRVLTAGPSFIANFMGEGFDGRQCNKWAHFHESGLLISEFGVTSGLTDVARLGAENIPGTAGNNLSPQIVENDGVYYIYHPDESWFSGIHRWSITNMASISIQEFSKTFNGTPTPATVPASNLLKDLPFNDYLVNGQHGWTRSPTTDSLGTNRPIYLAWTNALEPNPFKRSIGFAQDYDGDFYIQKALPTGAADWTFNATMWWEGWGVNVSTTEVDSAYLELLDASNKVIFAFTCNARVDLGQYLLIANGTTMQSWPLDDAKGGEIYTKQFHDLVVSPVDLSSKTLNISFGDLTPIVASIVDATADWLHPAYMKIRSHGSVGNTYKRSMTLKNLTFQ